MQAEWRAIDVGGRMSERKKWRKAFDAQPELLVYVIGLSGYHQGCDLDDPSSLPGALQPPRCCGVPLTCR